MANAGFFLGGAAEGIDTAIKNERANAALALEERGIGVRERGLEQEGRHQDRKFGLEEKALGIRERELASARQQKLISEVDGQIGSTMEVIGNTVNSALQAGRTPEQIEKAVMPLVQDVTSLASRVGRDPARYSNMVKTMLTNPAAIETAKSQGQAAAAKSQAVQDAGGSPLEPKARMEVENGLRDDFLKHSAPFITVKDAFDRISNIEKTGAGDVALLYSYMKVLDPGSTVREGELALAQQAAGVPDRVVNLYNSVLKGQKLPENLRKDIISQSSKLYGAAKTSHESTRRQFTDIAKRQGVDERNVILDFALPEKSGSGVDSSGNIPPPPAGFVVQP